MAIDNLRFKTKGGDFVVSLSAFVPHDNVPAGPTASCMIKDSGGLPPGLARLQVERPGGAHINGIVNSYAAAVAASPVTIPFANGRAGQSGGDRRIYFAGDNREFDPDATTYRLRQQVTVIADEVRDPDGVKDDSIRNLAGEIRGFAEDAMDDGVIDAADEDQVAGDCRLFHKAHLAETDQMNVDVLRTGPKSLEIRFSGTLNSPLVGPAQVLGAIDWDFTLTLDTAVEPARWTVSGAHDGFPAYELYVNGETIYQHDPGPPPYNFGKDLRKLLPPLDATVALTSGVLVQ